MYKGRVEQFRKIAFSGGGQEVIANAYQNDLTIAEKDLEKYNSSIFASQDIDVSPDFNFKQILLGQPPIKTEPTKGVLIISIAGLVHVFPVFFVYHHPGIAGFFPPHTSDLSEGNKDWRYYRPSGKIDLDKKLLPDYFDFNARSDREHNSIPFIENLRKLRYEIERSGKRVVLFTSTKAQEGKTTIVESLAHTIQHEQEKSAAD